MKYEMIMKIKPVQNNLLFRPKRDLLFCCGYLLYQYSVPKGHYTFFIDLHYFNPFRDLILIKDLRTKNKSPDRDDMGSNYQLT